MQVFWARRTTSERTALIIMAVGCSFLGVLWIWGQHPIESAKGFPALLGALAFGAVFLVCALPAALAILVLGGADFASPWRRAIDKVLPMLVLALLWLMLAGL